MFFVTISLWVRMPTERVGCEYV